MSYSPFLSIKMLSCSPKIVYYTLTIKRQFNTLRESIFLSHGLDPWKSTAEKFPEGTTKMGFGKSYDFAREQSMTGIESGELRAFYATPLVVLEQK